MAEITSIKSQVQAALLVLRAEKGNRFDAPIKEIWGQIPERDRPSEGSVQSNVKQLAEAGWVKMISNGRKAATFVFDGADGQRTVFPAAPAVNPKELVQTGVQEVVDRGKARLTEIERLRASAEEQIERLRADTEAQIQTLLSLNAEDQELLKEFQRVLAQALGQAPADVEEPAEDEDEDDNEDTGGQEQTIPSANPGTGTPIQASDQTALDSPEATATAAAAARKRARAKAQAGEPITGEQLAVAV